MVSRKESWDGTLDQLKNLRADLEAIVAYTPSHRQVDIVVETRRVEICRVEVRRSDG